MEILSYVAMMLFVFGINVLPAFVPPTWMFLLFFYEHFHLSFAPTVVLGAFAATCGRIVLARISMYINPYLPSSVRVNIQALGTFFNTHQAFSIPIVILYAFLPIPSNHVYIAAGLSGANVRLLAGSFFLGRLISYAAWIGVSHRIYDNLLLSVERYYQRPFPMVVEITGFIIMIILLKLPWKKLLKQIKI